MTDDANDVSEMWRDHKAMRSEKRASNRGSALTILQTNGISFESKNLGAHLVVSTQTETIDFWPGTGLWKSRNRQSGGRGIMRLIKYIKQE